MLGRSGLVDVLMLAQRGGAPRTAQIANSNACGPTHLRLHAVSRKRGETLLL